MTSGQFISDYKDALMFDQTPEEASEDISNEELAGFVNAYESLDHIKQNIFEKTISEGELRREEYGAGRALIDLQNHVEDTLSEFFQNEYGDFREMMADEALDILRNEMGDDEYDAYCIVRNTWEREEIPKDELPSVKEIMEYSEH